ncbi:hypothetical protein OH491_09355 [Termitidicoccus mucosus]|uniref:Fibronectin type-III domain-containing protein n=1 Tax=Termitidicoccus mucosus TaxID=1184151 RepID=A0A178IFY2_9BACT|nr:hypothetical protein AW736_19725 [Opitutaceae bacterium TSB47]
MNTIRQLLILSVIAAAVSSATAYAAPEKESPSNKKPASTATAVATDSSLKAERDGETVKLTWTLPKGEWRAVNITRNTSANPRNRVGVKSVKLEVTSYTDKVPDANAHYWYWLKLTAKDGQITNIGPVQAK